MGKWKDIMPDWLLKALLRRMGYTTRRPFPPVAKINSIRVLLSLIVNLDSPLILRGELEEVVYMELPPSLHFSSAKGKVCKFKKALYGLKYSSRAWFESLLSYAKIWL